jgi:hypothetical protein
VAERRQGGYAFKFLPTTIFVLAMGLPALAQPWPAVKPFTRQFDVDLAGGPVALDLPILSKEGSALYRLSCRGGSEEVLDGLGERDGVNWVGPFMCVLNLGNLPVSDVSLLAEDNAAPWLTRGQFHEGELVGACAAYPEFGLNRSFRLRGFVLRLSVGDSELDSDRSLMRFKLAVSVESDPTAKGDRAQRPDYLDPKGKCDVVRKGRDPLMCRVTTGPTAGSWAPCPQP